MTLFPKKRIVEVYIDGPEYHLAKLWPPTSYSSTLSSQQSLSKSGASASKAPKVKSTRSTSMKANKTLSVSHSRILKRSAEYTSASEITGSTSKRRKVILHVRNNDNAKRSRNQGRTTTRQYVETHSSSTSQSAGSCSEDPSDPSPDTEFSFVPTPFSFSPEPTPTPLSQKASESPRLTIKLPASPTASHRSLAHSPTSSQVPKSASSSPKIMLRIPPLRNVVEANTKTNQLFTDAVEMLRTSEIPLAYSEGLQLNSTRPEYAIMSSMSTNMFPEDKIPSEAPGIAMETEKPANTANTATSQASNGSHTLSAMQDVSFGMEIKPSMSTDDSRVLEIQSHAFDLAPSVSSSQSTVSESSEYSSYSMNSAQSSESLKTPETEDRLISISEDDRKTLSSRASSPETSAIAGTIRRMGDQSDEDMKLYTDDHVPVAVHSEIASENCSAQDASTSAQSLVVPTDILQKNIDDNTLPSSSSAPESTNKDGICDAPASPDYYDSEDEYGGLVYPEWDVEALRREIGLVVVMY